MPVNESIYQPSQRVVHTENATYENVLFNDNVNDFASTFTCEVSNVRGNVIETLELNGVLPNYFCPLYMYMIWPIVCLCSGVSISHSGFILGMLATVRCTSDIPVSIMEWLTNGVVVESAVSTQMLDLIIPLVNDSIHGDVFACRATRDNGMMAAQNFTIDVYGK